MKNSRNIWLSAIATLVIVTIIGIGSGFKPFAKNDNPKASLTYYFIGNSPSEANLAEKWSTTPPEDNTCSEGTMPCQVTLNTDINPDIASFINLRSASEVTSDGAVSRKPE